MWKPNLYVGYLKQYMVNWINIGMDAMTSDDFKDSIRKSFMRDARHKNMKSTTIKMTDDEATDIKILKDCANLLGLKPPLLSQSSTCW